MPLAYVHISQLEPMEKVYLHLFQCLFHSSVSHPNHKIIEYRFKQLPELVQISGQLDFLAFVQ